MRTLFTALLAGCLLLAPAHAAERPATSAELQDFVGQYTLADGRTLSVTQRRHRLIAQIDGEAAVVLLPAGPARFAAPGQHVALVFDQRSNGNVASVALTWPVDK